MNTLEEMHIYVRVAEMASFTQAADSLGLPKASISMAVKQLESEVGTRLLHRTTRKVEMTQDGRAFYERCRDMLADMEELQTMFQGGEQISGRLRVDMSSGIARNFVIPHLPEFLAQHPRLELELSSTDRRVDLVREGFDCVVRVGALGDSSLIARPLGRFRQINCASPAYVARYGMPQNLDELTQHRLIHYVSTLGAKATGFEYFDGERTHAVAMQGSITVNNADAYQAACIAGLGIIQAPMPGCLHLVESGAVVEVLPQYPAEPMPVSLLYANRRHLPKRAKVFMDWIAELMRANVE
ncbi:MAG TPA: LysR substrate-binding domain-containing protein [Rhodocyclaceae bacterium]|nr:LysR substrate-binding domain-containing protein [Rhodocyclaceae bacterium]